jgi:hypothetical protein
MSHVKVLIGAATEGDVGRNGAGEIAVGDCRQPIGDMGTERIAGVDLVTRDPNVHDGSPFFSMPALMPNGVRRRRVPKWER